ncbi:MAG: hypothetical protein HKN17_01525, partial [Rhodothermales bacterium]|nr:hypothetical protein [Rhodothermales bacterium]
MVHFGRDPAELSTAQLRSLITHTDDFLTSLAWVHPRAARSPIRLFLVVGLLFFVMLPTAFSQTVSVGLGSYRTSVPPGEVGPQDFQQQAVQPKVSSGFALPVQSNDYWSSLLYPFFGNPHSTVLYAHPINAQASAEG